MADDVKPTSASVAAEHAPARPGPTVAAREPAPVFPKRFRAAYFALAIVLGAAAGAFVLLMGARSNSNADWSAWQPTKTGEARAYEIADHVSDRYRHPSGSKLVTVPLAGPPLAQFPNAQGTVDEAPIRALVVRGRTRDFSDADVYPLSGENSVMYLLCGGGENCMMDEGAQSSARGQLLRREVLELALYSYRYLDGIENVIALMPPVRVTAENGQTADLQRLIFLSRGDVASNLRAPLEATLPGRPQLGMPPRETAAVNSVIVPNLYQYEIQRAPTGEPLLIVRGLPA